MAKFSQLLKRSADDETQDDLFPADELLRIGLLQIELAQRRRARREKRPPRLRQPHAVSAAIEQREAGLLLERGATATNTDGCGRFSAAPAAWKASLGRDSVEAGADRGA